MSKPFDTTPCHACGGTGVHKTAFADLDSFERRMAADTAHYNGDEAPATESECPFCKGEGEEPIYECEECNGLGFHRDIFDPNRTCRKCGGTGWYS